MSIEYTILPSRRLVHVRIWGVVSVTDLLEHYRALQADCAFDPAFWQLTDMREVTDVRGDGCDVALAARSRTFTPGVRRAVVAATDLQFGMARMFATYAEAFGHTVRVFRDLRSAKEWVGA
jgi:hypothetical protein